jgi:hypothetical protein
MGAVLDVRASLFRATQAPWITLEVENQRKIQIPSNKTIKPFLHSRGADSNIAKRI